MTTDITELAQKPTRYGTNSQGVFTNQTDGAYVSYLDFMALVEALEKAQRANAAQDDHINQQQDRIDTLEKRNAELGGQLSRYSMSPGQADQRACESRAARDALRFGKDADDVAPIDLRERIDGMKARIAELESRTVKLPESIVDKVCLTAAEIHAPVNGVTAGKPLTITLPDISSKAFWSGSGKTEVFHPETYRRWVKEAIERGCIIACIDVEVK